MDRQIVYPSAIPLETDLLSAQRFAMVGQGFLAQMVLGAGTIVDGLACTPTSPASMTVNVGPGSVAAQATIDATAYSSLPADGSALVKLGINTAATPFTLTAPATSGQSINYLIEASFAESDTDAVVLPFFNAANPSQPYTGPDNSATAENTQRIQRVGLQILPGAPANAGSQATPAVTPGWVPLYVVTVNYGQTTILAAGITTHPAAPFLSWKLPQLAPGFSRVVKFTSSTSWTVPNGVTLGRARVWAAGGGGGGAGGGSTTGGGGGAGGYTETIIVLTPGQVIPITVGNGGGGGSNTGGDGSDGGGSSAGSLCSATGGMHGGGCSTANQTGAGGGAGAGSFQGVTVFGSVGGPGYPAGNTYVGGNGGGAVQGGPPSLPNTSSSSTAQPGSSGNFPGGGGNGGVSGGNGGNGAPGYIIIEY